MRWIFAAVLLGAGPVSAADWRGLEGDEIRAVLTGKTVEYESAWQDFRASGATLYNAGADSWGRWDVQNGRYCSQWPPDASWSCYEVDLSADGARVRFRGPAGDVTTGLFRRAE